MLSFGDAVAICTSELLLPPHHRTSKDYGETLTPHKNPGGFRGLGTTLRAHPTQPDWVLARAKRPGCKLLDEVEMRCAADLFLSQVCRRVWHLLKPEAIVQCVCHNSHCLCAATFPQCFVAVLHRFASQPGLHETGSKES